MKFVEYFLTEISLHHRRMKIIRVFPRKTSCIQMILLNPQRNVFEKYGSMEQCLIEIDMEKVSKVICKTCNCTFDIKWQNSNKK